MKILKIFGTVVFSGVGFVVILLLLSTIYHTFKLKIESEEYPAPGKLVQINNNNMHVYTYGQGDITLVFMSGSGTSNPTIDFKPLCMRLTDSIN